MNTDTKEGYGADKGTERSEKSYYRSQSEFLWSLSKIGMTSSNSLPPDVILGLTHLWYDGKLVRLLKCSFCNFRNIHEDTITHHIRWTDDAKHDVDLNSLDKNSFIVTKKQTESPYGPYISKEDLPLPWITCLWCSYRDKIEFDLSLHFLEKHKKEILKLQISFEDRRRAFSPLEPSLGFFTKFEPLIEFKLDVAVEMAKEENRGKGVNHAIQSLQNRIRERRASRERREQGEKS